MLPAPKTVASTSNSPPKKSSLALPPPSATSSSKPKKGPKKITIDLPALPQDGSDDEDDPRPAAKKPRLDSGSGSGKSSLFSMLPAPKLKAPVKATAAPERVLGGGGRPGLVFNASRSLSAPQPVAAPLVPEDATQDEEEETEGAVAAQPEAASSSTSASSTLFLPPSLKKGRTNISLGEDAGRTPRPSAQSSSSVPSISAAPPVDFFSLGSTTSTASSSTTPSTSSSIKFTLPSVSSAPDIDEFVPPEPTPTDPYPGYYQLPSGTWAAHDPAYYQKFYDKWKRDYDAQVRAMEKNPAKGFEGADGDDTTEVNAAKEMERARIEIKEREDAKNMTQGTSEGQQAAPKMNVKGAKLSGRARSRHQLTTLLTEAYENREMLEQKIAEGRRNRKEAGNKYGAFLSLSDLITLLYTSPFVVACATAIFRV
ncbi:uncharacterized protein STEHIDRAFT_166335 [Stereum hirsutum FP-91666 SS1]|uniref:uncharacterized protein n=1 Tax=Stereum hirsutum (strain FP-91666) TaxID=721885 RepID=UPI000440EBFE|nr:uncharacterized protein STEHIDRAFT_166335 [Stereum hirsutum FP-91666 SS1]EIM90074.1 hypothetical protein STEHIDRAFT_166335 [Stereum hirsutum FP-91666 SS1]